MSSLKDQLRADRVAAMKAHDATVKDALAMALTAVQREETSGEAHELTDDQVRAVIKREVAMRKDSAEAYRAGNRPELEAKELAEAEVLGRYLPAELSAEEIGALVAEEVAAAREAAGGELAMKQMGLIIKAVNARAEGRADGATVAAQVKAALVG